MTKRARSLGILLVLTAVILAAGAIPVQAQGSLEEDTPTEDTWQSITYLHEEGEVQYYEFEDTDGNAHLYERDEDDDWKPVTPAAPATNWKRIHRLWEQGEASYFAFFEAADPGLQGFVYKLENGTLNDLTPAPPPATMWEDFEFLEEIDGTAYLSFCATGGCGLVESDSDTFTVLPIEWDSDILPTLPVQAPFPLTWTEIILLGRAGTSRYFRFEDPLGNQYLHDRDATTTRQALHHAPAPPNRTPPGGPWKLIEFMEEHNGKDYFHLQDGSGNDYVRALDGDTWDIAAAVTGVWQERCILPTIFHILAAPVTPAGTQYQLHRLESGSLVDRTPEPVPVPPGLYWKEILCYGGLDGKGYVGFVADGSRAYLFEEENGILTDLTPATSGWLEIAALGPEGIPQYFRSTDDTPDQEKRVHRRKSVVSRSQSEDPLRSALEDITPTGTWKRIAYQNELDNKDYFEFVHSDSNRAYLYRLEGDAWQDLTPTPPAARQWKSILFLLEQNDKMYYEFVDDSDDAHFYEVDDSSEVARPVRLDHRGHDLTPTGRWRSMRTVHRGSRRAACRFVDDSGRNRFFDLTQPGTVAIKNATIPAGGSGFSFAQNIEGLNDFPLNDGGEKIFPAVLPGQYTVTEYAPSPHWDLTGLVCEDSDEQGEDSTEDKASRRATINVDPGETVTCTFTNTERGTIIIEKETKAGGGGGFQFSQNVDSSGDFGLDDGQSKTFLEVVPGQYAVTENGPPGSPDHYVLTGLVCEDSDPQGVASTTDKQQRTATVNLDPGETVTCTYTNTELGTIIIEKETRPGGGSGFSFSQNVDSSGDFGLDDGQSITHLHVLPGQYAITELDPLVQPGHYDLTDLVCEDSDPQGVASTTNLDTRTATVNLDPGETVTCTFTNREWGKIVVEKATEPGGDTTSFAFSGKINAGLKDGERQSRRVRPGTYTVQETVPAGWDLTHVTCTNDRSHGDLKTATATFRVWAGETVKCTFTNTKWGKITVKKQTAPAEAARAFSFSGAIDASLKDGQFLSLQVKPGTYKVTEALPADWRLTSITCDDSNSAGDKGSGRATFQADPGEHVTCIFANTHEDVVDPPGTLVVAQKTVSPGDPTNSTFTYTGDVSGQIRDGQRLVQGGLKAGTYTSQQLVPEGWVLASIECDDGESSGDVETATATFRLQAGETVVCTFTDLRLHHVYLPLVLR